MTSHPKEIKKLPVLRGEELRRWRTVARAERDKKEKRLKEKLQRVGIPYDSRMKEIIVGFGEMFDGSNFEADMESAFGRSTLHEITEPLDRVLQILSRVANGTVLCEALGGDLAGARRLEDLIGDLEKIWSAARSLPGRGRGRPSKTGDLYSLVDVLVRHWEVVKGKDEKFTQRWNAGKPTSPGARFARAIVEYVAPERLPSLPKVTEKVVSARLKQRAS